MEVVSFDVENLSWAVHPSQPAWRTTSIPTRIRDFATRGGDDMN